MKKSRLLIVAVAALLLAVLPLSAFALTARENVAPDYQTKSGEEAMTVRFEPTSTEFADSIQIVLVPLYADQAAGERYHVAYTLDGTNPDIGDANIDSLDVYEPAVQSKVVINGYEYTEPITITETTTIKAICYNNFTKGAVMTMTYTKVDDAPAANVGYTLNPDAPSMNAPAETPALPEAPADDANPNTGVFGK